MKKLLSILLSAAMIATFIPVMANAEDSSPASTPVKAVTNFDGTQATLYTDGKYNPYCKIVDSGNEKYGNVLKFDTVTGNNWPEAFRLINETSDAPYQVTKDVEYYLSFEMSRVDVPTGYSLALIIVQDYNGVGQLGAVSSWNPYVIINNSTSANASYCKWRKKFTATATGQPVLVLYNGNSWKTTCDIRIDNVAITPVNYESTKVTFSDNQLDYYQSSDSGEVATTTLVDLGGEHGKVMNIHKVTWAGFQWPTSLRLCDSTGTSDFYMKSGKTYDVSYDIKIQKATCDVNLGIVFTSSSCGNLGTWNSYDGNRAYLGWYGKGTNGDWKHVTTKVTATKDCIPTFTNYGDGAENQEIYLDNIEIKDATTKVTYHYNNGDADKIVETATGEDFETPMLIGAKFDGWFLDKELTKSAGTTVASTCDVYAKWETVVYDTDNNSLVTLYDKGFAAIENEGLNGTKAFGTVSPSTNTAWPIRTLFKNADNTDFIVKAGHNYQVSFYSKAEDYTKLQDGSRILLADSKGDISDIGAHTYSALYLKSYYTNGGKGYNYTTLSFTATDAQNGHVLCFAAYNCGCNIYLDDVTIKDMTAKDSYTSDEKNISASITIGTDISMNMFGKSLKDAINPQIKYTMNGTSVIADSTSGSFKFKGINPGQMGDKIKAELYSDGNVIETVDDYSVQKYCESLLKMTASDLKMSESKYANLSLLTKDLLHYGAAAQKYFNYKANELVNANIEGGSTFVAPTSDKDITHKTADGVTFTGQNVYFENTNKLMFRFKLDDGVNVSDVKIKISDGEETKTIEASDFEATDDGSYIVYSDAINATEFATVFTATASVKGNDGAYVKYSVNSYVASMYNNSNASEAMQELAKATYNYGVSAVKYADAN